MMSRYDAHGIETEFELGSRGRVLRNLLGIRSIREMHRAESEALLTATNQLIDETTQAQRFTASDISMIHRRWLSAIYAWAGEYRSVNLAKHNFMFAAADQVPRLMREFEQGPLRDYTPCHFDVVQEQEEALAVVHAELILIHPFREGNGRCARVLATLMALQTDLPPLDFSGVEGREKRRYIAAIHAAMGRNYAPMKEVFRRIIARSLRASRKKE
jgi:cell filamentation protein, protein adenylyltransferase